MGTKTNPGEYDCYAKAEDDEPLFTLLGRDRHAPGLVRQWADRYQREKVRSGTFDEKAQAKVVEAYECADAMRLYQRDRDAAARQAEEKALLAAQAEAEAEDPQE